MPPDNEAKVKPTVEQAWNDLRKIMQHDLPRSVRRSASHIQRLPALRRRF